MPKQKLTRSKLRSIIKEEAQKLNEVGNRTPAAFARALSGAEIMSAEATARDTVELRIQDQYGEILTARIEGGDLYLD